MIQRTKIALIMPYFGNFPNYFALWECSASKNRDIDFLVIQGRIHTKTSFIYNASSMKSKNE